MHRAERCRVWARDAPWSRLGGPAPNTPCVPVHRRHSGLRTCSLPPPSQCRREAVINLQSWTPVLSPWWPVPSQPHRRPVTCPLSGTHPHATPPCCQGVTKVPLWPRTWPMPHAPQGTSSLMDGPRGPCPVPPARSAPGQWGAVCSDRELQWARLPGQRSPQEWGVCLSCSLCPLAQGPPPSGSRGPPSPEKPEEEGRGGVMGRGIHGRDVHEAPTEGAGGSRAGLPPAPHRSLCTEPARTSGALPSPHLTVLCCPQMGLLLCSPDGPCQTPSRAPGTWRCECSKCLLILQPLAGRRL